MRTVGILWVVLLAGACTKASSDTTGKERGACYGNGTCDQGLQCLSQVCVRPPPADCDKVAAKLAGYRLGNYAPREERDAALATLAQQCADAQLSEDEGACILNAKGRLELAGCPRPLLEELAPDKTGCAEAAQSIVNALTASMGQAPDMRAKIERVTPEALAALTGSCVDDRWPKELVRCTAIARTPEDMNQCEKVAPKEFIESVGKKLEPVIEKLMR
jgi:hypothetical protein